MSISLKGIWSSSTTYPKDAIVRYDTDGKTYISLSNNNTNHIPSETNSEYWKDLAGVKYNSDQPDWDETDTTKSSYIQNKPFWRSSIKRTGTFDTISTLINTYGPSGYSSITIGDTTYEMNGDIKCYDIINSMNETTNYNDYYKIYSIPIIKDNNEVIVSVTYEQGYAANARFSDDGSYPSLDTAISLNIDTLGMDSSYNKLFQADWEEENSAKSSYILNKPIWKETQGSLYSATYTFNLESFEAANMCEDDLTQYTSFKNESGESITNVSTNHYVDQDYNEYESYTIFFTYDGNDYKYEDYEYTNGNKTYKAYIKNGNSWTEINNLGQLPFEQIVCISDTRQTIVHVDPDYAAGLQPDWNQNDSTESDYIKNKPMWISHPEEVAHYDFVHYDEEAYPEIKQMCEDDLTQYTSFNDGTTSGVITNVSKQHYVDQDYNEYESYTIFFTYDGNDYRYEYYEYTNGDVIYKAYIKNGNLWTEINDEWPVGRICCYTGVESVVINPEYQGFFDGLGQSQPDWDQNDSTESDYIQNKPLYKETEEVLKTTYTFAYNDSEDVVNMYNDDLTQYTSFNDGTTSGVITNVSKDYYEGDYEQESYSIYFTYNGNDYMYRWETTYNGSSTTGPYYSAYIKNGAAWSSLSSSQWPVSQINCMGNNTEIVVNSDYQDFFDGLGAQSDWAQNDTTESDYIKNKPMEFVTKRDLLSGYDAIVLYDDNTDTQVNDIARLYSDDTTSKISRVYNGVFYDQYLNALSDVRMNYYTFNYAYEKGYTYTLYFTLGDDSYNCSYSEISYYRSGRWQDPVIEKRYRKYMTYEGEYGQETGYVSVDIDDFPVHKIYAEKGIEVDLFDETDTDGLNRLIQYANSVGSYNNLASIIDQNGNAVSIAELGHSSSGNCDYIIIESGNNRYECKYNSDGTHTYYIGTSYDIGYGPEWTYDTEIDQSSFPVSNIYAFKENIDANKETVYAYKVDPDYKNFFNSLGGSSTGSTGGDTIDVDYAIENDQMIITMTCGSNSTNVTLDIADNLSY